MLANYASRYFLRPTDLFFSLSAEPLHFLHWVALSGFLTPHLKQTLKKSLRFCAICFLVASVIGKTGILSTRPV
jgi:hypothetical protein